MEYRALFKINGGVSHGFGIKYPEEYFREDVIEGNSDPEAIEEASRFGRRYALEALSNPETGITNVTLLSLVSRDGQQALDRTLEFRSDISQKLLYLSQPGRI